LRNPHWKEGTPSSGANITIMSRRAYLIFGDIEGKLDVAVIVSANSSRNTAQGKHDEMEGTA
jgi:hypothetical protein